MIYMLFHNILEILVQVIILLYVRTVEIGMILMMKELVNQVNQM